MSPPTQQEGNASEVGKFYQGKTIFITGAAGFLGAVLLEILLRCCPGICRIYILLRPKKGVQPEDRKEAIFKKEIFNKVKEKDPDSVKKVVVLSGDVCKENLGISEEESIKVIQEVSIVFHCAAAITFLKPLRYMMEQNVIGTNNVIEFCRKLKNLDALVYTSTAYSNANRTSEILEKVYDLPFDVEDALKFATCGNDEELNNQFKMVDPLFPNFYTFSKCVAENLLLKNASEMPISIIRPSIIVCCFKGSHPGYIEYGSALVTFSVGIGKGFIRVLRIDEGKICHNIPADAAANTHVVAAFLQATQRLHSPVVYNCTSDEVAKITWGEFITDLLETVKRYPMPKSYQRPSLTMCKGPVKYWIFSVFDHYAPAAVIDILMWITGRKLRLLKLYQFLDKCLVSMTDFTLNDWDFRTENYRSIPDKLNEIDKELFPVDLDDYCVKTLAKRIVAGAPMYNSKDDKPYEERLRLTYIRFFFTSLIKWSLLGGIVSIFYALVF